MRNRIGDMVSNRAKGMPRSKIKAMSDDPLLNEVINLQAGDPDFKTPSHIIEAALEAMEENRTHYTQTAGIAQLREAISEKLKRENSVSYDPDTELITTNGGTGALALAVASVLNEGEEILVPDPAWPNYEPMVAAAGGIVKPYILHKDTGFLPDADEIEALVTKRTKAIIVNSPGNPTGSVFDRKLLSKLVEVAERTGILMISDEVYENIIFDGYSHVSLASLPGARDITLTVNSFSKTYAMTGWRLGYAAGPSEIVGAMKNISSALSLSPSTISQYAGLAALKGPQDCVSKMREQYRVRRNLFVGTLNEMPGIWAPVPHGAFYAFADFSESLKQNASTVLLERSRVAGVPGSAFGKSCSNYVRFSFASSEEALQEALERIKKVMDQR
ncbi:MAG: pyridoxal phosphate-dependent aminotransferase [Thermoprotei archaeon]